jgi:hypothetical protein
MGISSTQSPRGLPGRIRHALMDDLPETLDRPYERMSREIEATNLEFARRLLIWPYHILQFGSACAASTVVHTTRMGNVCLALFLVEHGADATAQAKVRSASLHLGSPGEWIKYF